MDEYNESASKCSFNKYTSSRIMKIAFLLLNGCAQFFNFCLAQESHPPFYSNEASLWADSIIATLNPDQRAGQLFMIAAWSNKDSTHVNEIKYMINNYGIG